MPGFPVVFLTLGFWQVSICLLGFIHTDKGESVGENTIFSDKILVSCHLYFDNGVFDTHNLQIDCINRKQDSKKYIFCCLVSLPRRGKM